MGTTLAHEADADGIAAGIRDEFSHSSVHLSPPGFPRPVGLLVFADGWVVPGVTMHFSVCRVGELSGIEDYEACIMVLLIVGMVALEELHHVKPVERIIRVDETSTIGTNVVPQQANLAQVWVPMDSRAGIRILEIVEAKGNHLEFLRECSILVARASGILR